MYKEWNRNAAEYIDAHLKKSRIAHTMGVREEAVRLAKRFGADPAKAETAALYHDIAKYMSIDEMNALIEREGLDNRFLDNANLAHSKAAMILARDRFGVDDPEILNAISYHTTGRAGMGTLEKVIFLADAIEPGRDYPSVNEIRLLAEDDLDAACVCTLRHTIEYLNGRGIIPDPDSAEALLDLQRHS